MKSSKGLARRRREPCRRLLGLTAFAQCFNEPPVSQVVIARSREAGQRSAGQHLTPRGQFCWLLTGRVTPLTLRGGWHKLANRNVRAGVAEWQTRWTQNPVGAIQCGFKSHLRYFEDLARGFNVGSTLHVKDPGHRDDDHCQPYAERREKALIEVLTNIRPPLPPSS